MRNSWIEELWQLALLLSLGLLVGLLAGHVWLALTLVLLGYALRNLYNLQRLIHWLNDPGGTDIPIQFGIWGTIYAQVQRMRSGHHQRERRLNELLSQFQASASALPDAAVALGPVGEIRWYNKAAKKLLKLRSREDIGQPFVNLFRAPELINYLDKGNFKKPLDVNAPGNSHRKLSIRVATYGDGESLLLAQDITERVLAEQIRKDFVGNVSHELRTPLTVISGFVENMQLAKDQLPVHWQKPVDLMEGQVARMRSIVEDLLLLARLEGGRMSDTKNRVDMPALISTIAHDGRVLAGDQVSIDVRIEANQAFLAGDLGQLRSAFTNLLVNAINHTPKGGQIRLIWENYGRGCRFTVEDTGEGIAAEHIPRLTERFYRVDVGRSRERGGTGLGLAIVKHILQHYGARLEIQSTVGEGSRFSCIFPHGRCYSDPA